MLLLVREISFQRSISRPWFFAKYKSSFYRVETFLFQNCIDFDLYATTLVALSVVALWTSLLQVFGTHEQVLYGLCRSIAATMEKKQVKVVSLEVYRYYCLVVATLDYISIPEPPFTHISAAVYLNTKTIQRYIKPIRLIFNNVMSDYHTYYPTLHYHTYPTLLNITQCQTTTVKQFPCVMNTRVMKLTPGRYPEYSEC